MGLFEDLFQIGDGLRSGVTDAPSFVVNLLSGDVHGASTDGRNLIGDVVGILDGVEGLGVSLGEIPKRYLGSAAKLADSKILAAAQLAIEGQKALTGSGDPDEGNGYRDSARRLEGTVETLIDAAPKDDRWDGAAAEAYAEMNAAHRRLTSDISVADRAIGDVIATQAAQVRRTRHTLDEASQGLYDFGLATSWMNFIPGMAAAKVAADLASASAALATTQTELALLMTSSAENAERIGCIQREYTLSAEAMSDQESAAARTPELAGPCGSLVGQKDDLANLPRRIREATDYEIPHSEPQWGPPATPYSAFQPAPVAPPRSPSSPALPAPKRFVASPAAGTAPHSQRDPSLGGAARGQFARSGRAPVITGKDNTDKAATSDQP
ncbi:hypothetical protein FK535_01240 [Mycolicibacterium sp. 018/SC-01/001]|uniref:EspA/EspE family type VII secretion system effector n=1 Tax=Mycolicibacterium sp. 018/SC-01/001 TaxID=2592069 RepID=UPI001181752C|nr:EspA/EspE family type VII secretion system effector [Mycolicibacterium sp. 018/SC-01/001]TRW88929.1 hypothetical protein FK535_01240 [Mycolicibacterium sp. 018/SC-01/001]